jgi:hypothetical protein
MANSQQVINTANYTHVLRCIYHVVRIPRRRTKGLSSPQVRLVAFDRGNVLILILSYLTNCRLCTGAVLLVSQTTKLLYASCHTKVPARQMNNSMSDS